jgi:hypothetical protein
VLPELQLAVDDEVLSAKNMEGLVRRADIGGCLLDDAAELLEAPGRFRADLAYFIVIGGECDPFGCCGLRHGVAE